MGIKTTFGLIGLIGLVATTASAWWPSSGDFDTTYFKTSANKITLVNTNASYATNAGYATTAGSATTASAGWPTTWSGSAITTAVPQATHATNADNATLASSALALSAQAGAANVTDLNVTNCFYYITNSGSLTVNMAKAKQMISASGAVTIAGFSNIQPWADQTVVLRITNGTGGPVTLSWPASVLSSDGNRGAICTNGQWRVVTFSVYGGITTNASTTALW